MGLPAVSSVYVTTKYLISMEPAPGVEPGTCRLRRNRSREARHGLRVYAGTGEGYEFPRFPGVSRSRNFRRVLSEYSAEVPHGGPRSGTVESARVTSSTCKG